MSNTRTLCLTVAALAALGLAVARPAAAQFTVITSQAAFTAATSSVTSFNFTSPTNLDTSGGSYTVYQRNENNPYPTLDGVKFSASGADGPLYATEYEFGGTASTGDTVLIPDGSSYGIADLSGLTGVTAAATSIGSYNPGTITVTATDSLGRTDSYSYAGTGDRYDPQGFVGFLDSGAVITEIDYAGGATYDKFEYGSANSSSAAPEASQTAGLAIFLVGLAGLILKARKRTAETPAA